MEKKITKKTKLLIAAAIVVVIAGGISAAVLLHNPLKLQKDTVNVEFGQQISTDAKDYLAKDVDKDIVKSTKVTYKKNPVEGQSYDQIGEYTVKLKYKSKEKDVTVKVADTTAPEFNATATAGIDTIEGVDLNFNELITVTDLSPAEVSFDASGVDLKTPGTYTLKATAKDKAGNEATKDVTVTVAKKPANMSGSSVSVDSKTGKVTVQSKSRSSSSGSKSYSSSKGSSSSSSKGSGGSSSKGSGGSSSGGWNYGGQIPGGGYWEYTEKEDWDGIW